MLVHAVSTASISSLAVALVLVLACPPLSVANDAGAEQRQDPFLKIHLEKYVNTSPYTGTSELDLIKHGNNQRTNKRCY